MAKISINLATGTLQKAEIIVGIDLGTTNSLVAFIDPDNHPMVINDTGKGRLVPSVIHFDAGGLPLLGNEAKAFLMNDPSNTIYAVKRLLGKSDQEINALQDTVSYGLTADNNDTLIKIQTGNQLHTPIGLLAEILKELKKRAEHALKTPVNKAVIAVPSYFSDDQRKAIRDAGRLASLEVLRIVNETTAAALAYGIDLKPAEQKTIFVYDLGGGKFDLSIIKIHNSIFEVLAAKGKEYPGGDDFDRAIVQYWIENNKLDPASIKTDKSLMQQLRLKAEEAKKALDTQNLFNEKSGDIWYTLDKQTFEHLIADQAAATLSTAEQVLADAKLTVKDIDEVLLVGGSSRTPYIKTQLAGFFGIQPYQGINPDEAVALGAAIQADIMAGNRSYIGVPDEDMQKAPALSTAAAQRMLDEARAEGEQLAYLAGQFIERHRFVLTSMDISGTRTILDKLRAALTQDDKNNIRQLTTELNEFTRPFAARLLNVKSSSPTAEKKD
jgi:molecular chaperone DnaK (HSP70)